MMNVLRLVASLPSRSVRGIRHIFWPKNYVPEAKRRPIVSEDREYLDALIVFARDSYDDIVAVGDAVDERARALFSGLGFGAGLVLTAGGILVANAKHIPHLVLGIVCGFGLLSLVFLGFSLLFARDTLRSAVTSVPDPVTLLRLQRRLTAGLSIRREVAADLIVGYEFNRDATLMKVRNLEKGYFCLFWGIVFVLVAAGAVFAGAFFQASGGAAPARRDGCTAGGVPGSGRMMRVCGVSGAGGGSNGNAHLLEVG